MQIIGRIRPDHLSMLRTPPRPCTGGSFSRAGHPPFLFFSNRQHTPTIFFNQPIWFHESQFAVIHFVSVVPYRAHNPCTGAVPGGVPYITKWFQVVLSNLRGVLRYLGIRKRRSTSFRSYRAAGRRWYMNGSLLFVFPLVIVRSEVFCCFSYILRDTTGNIAGPGICRLHFRIWSRRLIYVLTLAVFSAKFCVFVER